ncbi:hypothetical protein Pint_07875 [Pistacia integerrima]|uniref:Uncharacterized protein n=1 Tax=Pistacia integerrima TaxID=434235 RepID=A0ACC0XYE9_9ROSI|nr:hypothetical protein Pint_07875 [Pistacia integerrima]
MAKKRKSQEEEPNHEPKTLKSSSSSDEESESEEADEVEEQKESPSSSSSSSSSSSEEEEAEGEEDDDDDEEEEDDDDEHSKLENVKKLLEPFSKDQLIAILKEATQSNPSITAEIISSADSDPVHRKIFVHGLGWDATNETLMAALKLFGPIEECNVVTDKTTGRSKGYGFVLFKTRAAARKALKEPQKKIGNRMAACQLASTGPVQNQNQPGSEVSARKLYVANVGPQISPEKLSAFFTKFGEIEDGPLGFDKMTGKFRGFAIIVYKTLEGIKKALEEPVKMFDGAKLLCSIAVEGRSAKNNNNASSGPTPVATGVNAAIMPGLTVGFNPGAVLLGQNPAALGVLNPVLGVGAGAFAGGVTQPLNNAGNAAATMGLNPGFGVQQGINGMNPSMMGGYGSQATFQGLGAFQNSQVGQPSAPAIGAAAARSQTGNAPFVGR